MEKLNDELLRDLLLTKAMENSIGQVDRWESLNDVVEEVLANGEVDKDQYFASIMKLTQLGLVKSNIKNEEDLEMSEMEGCDIIGVTKEGNEYINRLSADTTTKEKVTELFDKFNEACKKLNDNEPVKLLGTTLAILSSLIKIVMK